MEAAQKKIDDLHMKQLDETRKLALECNVKKNAIFAERTKLLKEKAPKDFWLQVFSNHPDFKSELMGDYDAEIFRSLEDFTVTMNPDGFTIDMYFGPNNYFTNNRLTYQEIEEPQKETVIKTSGINWKEGKGPLSVTEEQEKERTAAKAKNPWTLPTTDSNSNDNKESGQRRERDEDEHRGFSFFSFFEELPAVPKKEDFARNGDNNEDDFEDDEGFGDNDSFLSELDHYDQLIEERREIARCICDEIWDSPENYLTEQA